MDRSEKTIITNMCMIYDDAGYVLVQDRKDPGWKGIAFPGGHVEAAESFTDAVIREVYEETGLRISQPYLCGIKQWPYDGDTRYVILLYKTNRFTGDLTSSPEGEVYWTKLSELPALNLAKGMAKTLRVFLEENLSEHYWQVKDGVWLDSLR